MGITNAHSLKIRLSGLPSDDELVVEAKKSRTALI